MEFLTEADKLKNVIRNNTLLDATRRENTAEHSWHVALLALVAAPYFPQDVDVDRAIAMLILHDLVEIDAGDHPIHQRHDPQAIAAKEQAAADRLYAILPSAQGSALRALWQEFETSDSATAQFARACDWLHPEIMTLMGRSPTAAHLQISIDNLKTGRVARLQTIWPDAYHLIQAMVDGRSDDTPLGRVAGFIAQTDALKHVLRATPILQGSRRENSGEHSWHLCLFALVLADHSITPSNVSRVIRMLLIHDLVEIDVGDTPIHGDFDQTDIEARELKAARRIFGLLPKPCGADLLALWQEFEAAQSADAVFGKSLDRVQPVMANLCSGGGTWPEYKVTPAQLETRVGTKVKRGAPAIWAALHPRIEAWFEAHKT
nr:HD domain-containing protein [Nereida sp. MMG025]